MTVDGSPKPKEPEPVIVEPVSVVNLRRSLPHYLTLFLPPGSRDFRFRPDQVSATIQRQPGTYPDGRIWAKTSSPTRAVCAHSTRPQLVIPSVNTHSASDSAIVRPLESESRGVAAAVRTLRAVGERRSFTTNANLATSCPTAASTTGAAAYGRGGFGRMLQMCHYVICRTATIARARACLCFPSLARGCVHPFCTRSLHFAIAVFSLSSHTAPHPCLA